MKVKSTLLPQLFFSTDKYAAKIFIKLLLNPDPAKRPTALEAYNNHVSRRFAHLRRLYSQHGDVQWLTAHEASTEYDVAFGLREHFDARKRWRSAIASARAVHRFGKHSRSPSASTTGSGGWGRDHMASEAEGPSSEVPSHDESPSDVSESFMKLSFGSSDPGTNVNVKVTRPEEGETEEKGKVEGSSLADDSLTGSSKDGLKDEVRSDTPLNAQVSGEAGSSLGQLAEFEVKKTVSISNKDLSVGSVDTPHSEIARSVESDLSELKMPGTFHTSKVEREEIQRTPFKWSETFRKLGLFI